MTRVQDAETMRKGKPRRPLGAPTLRRLLLMCLVTGVVAGLGAAGFLYVLDAATAYLLGGLAGYYPAGACHEQNPFVDATCGEGSIVRWMLLILPALGGLVSGFIVFRFAPETEGHGTDAAIEAYHFKDGTIRKRAPWIKAIASAITIGTGGSGGREGPIAQIGSGFASMLSGWLRVPPEERRILMAAGMAAGVGAIFQAPLAGALFAAEVLYRGPDMEHEVFVPAFVTSIIAYSVFGSLFGFHPLFVTPDYTYTNAVALLPFAALGVICAGGAWLYVKVFYGVRGVFFERLSKIPNHLKPAIGGLLTGIVGFFLPEALGAGYGVVQGLFNQEGGTLPEVLDLPSASALLDMLPAGTTPAIAAAVLLAIIAFAKIGTTAFSIGSGGSGGVFGPAIVIGGAFGGAFGLIATSLFPGLPVQPGAFALVGMAGFFAGAAHTPISTIIMVSEITGNYSMLVPSMLVCLISFLLCRKFTLYEKQLGTRLDAPSKVGHMARAILRRVTVGDALAIPHVRDFLTVRERTTFGEMVDLYTHSDQTCFPVLDDEGTLSGIVDADDLRLMVMETAMSELVIASDISKPPVTITPKETVLAAINTMVRGERDELVVVDADDPTRPVDTLRRGDVVAAYNKVAAESGPIE